MLAFYGLRENRERAGKDPMPMRQLFIALALLVPLLPAQSSPPNVVLIFVDDMGYADIGKQGAEGWKTPNLDRLADEGVRLTNFYAAQPVCSASRAGLLTGCYPNRVGISGALGPRARHGLNPEEVTIAELCKSKGYATAIYGKWHLGHRPEFLPNRQGFDDYVGTPYSNDMWPLHPAYAHLPSKAAKRKRGYPDLPLYHNDEIIDPEITGEDQMRFTSGFTDRGIEFIRKNKERPFFLYLPHPMPHVPLFTSKEFEGSSKQGRYGDVIQEIDHSVGRILDELKRLKLDEKTLVIFTSDNGPWLSYGNHAGSALPLREGKGTTWEGGVRVPFIARWPGRIPKSRVCDAAAMTIDILPTIAGLIDAALPERKIDGKDIWKLLSSRGDPRSPHEVLLFYYHDNHLEALRSGRWKLVFPHRYRSLIGTPGKDGRPNGYSQKRCGLELYDLAADVSESKDVAADHPEVVARLQKYAEAARADLGDALTKRKGSGRRPAGRIPKKAEKKQR